LLSDPHVQERITLFSNAVSDANGKLIVAGNLVPAISAGVPSPELNEALAAIRQAQVEIDGARKAMALYVAVQREAQAAYMEANHGQVSA
jgi:hypothetical protein